MTVTVTPRVTEVNNIFGEPIKRAGYRHYRFRKDYHQGGKSRSMPSITAWSRPGT